VASVALDASDAPGELGEPSPSLAAPPEPEAAAESRPPAEWLRLSVTDTGYGMSAEEQARLFTKFFRSGRAEVRRERGTGLGLALSKQMVERLGGTIEVQSALGAGSTFTVALPLVSPPDAVVGHTDANTKAMPSLG
ncbi:MAG: sensor histidine kinase, partial [Chloroflexota bacterium]